MKLSQAVQAIIAITLVEVCDSKAPTYCKRDGYLVAAAGEAWNQILSAKAMNRSI